MAQNAHGFDTLSHMYTSFHNKKSLECDAGTYCHNYQPTSLKSHVIRTRCRVTTRVRGERGRTTGVLNRRAGDRRGKERERPAYVWAKKHTGTRPVNAEDTSGARDRAKDTNICIFKNKYRIRERLQLIRLAKQMPMPVRQRTQGIRWRYCRKHTGVPRSSTSLPKPAERS